ncbi:transcriptional regulator, TetR family [Dyella sp. OK004]|uniref:TetR/AcrR family transcriptional regulator n=1 Tax=Dyella sp. OK004 TaxID=1855292 RepID=UPI0008F34DA1|nr:TetR/AcrR family transcriptional regulator [Dyella sp. OK004]SFS01632.1 transcriptional regulator, TetR family [Dyella sp. OK004]
MPYSTEHKQKTRERIVECARELFNRRGFAEVSIDEIMQRAGLTRGGFYNHFKAKEELFAEAIAAYQNFNPAQRWKEFDFDNGDCGATHARQLVNAYLSNAHLEDIEGHCPMIALPSDTARASPRVKQAYRDLLERMAGLLAEGMSLPDGADRRQRGLAMAALCVGGMVLARTVDDPAFGDEVRLAARAMALELIGAGEH